MRLFAKMETEAGDSDVTAFKAFISRRLAELMVWLIPKTVCVAGEPRLNVELSCISSTLGHSTLASQHISRPREVVKPYIREELCNRSVISWIVLSDVSGTWYQTSRPSIAAFLTPFDGSDLM